MKEADLVRLAHGPAGARRFPRVSLGGVVVMIVGLFGDLIEHALIGHADEATIAGFPLEEHAAHLVVLVGMVLVLAGIVADGVRSSGRSGRQERSDLGDVAHR
ncbi:MAG TPA: hypothetical protein VGK63_01755 [Candidatus Limnocylindrales bacterium]